MPDTPRTPGSDAIRRSWEYLRSRGGDYLRRQLAGLQNSVPGTRNWSWQQTLDALTNGAIPLDLYNSREGRWNTPREWLGFGGGTRPGEPLPDWMAPGATLPTEAAGWQLPTMPGQLPQGQGPLMSYQREPTIRERGLLTTGAGRQGGTTVVADNPHTRTNEAGDAARGFASTGLRSSSYGRDQLMNRHREK